MWMDDQHLSLLRWHHSQFICGNFRNPRSRFVRAENFTCSWSSLTFQQHLLRFQTLDASPTARYPRAPRQRKHEAETPERL